MLQQKMRKLTETKITVRKSSRSKENGDSRTLWHTQNVTKCVLRIQCVLNIKRWIFRIHKYRRTQ